MQTAQLAEAVAAAIADQPAVLLQRAVRFTRFGAGETAIVESDVYLGRDGAEGTSTVILGDERLVSAGRTRTVDGREMAWSRSWSVDSSTLAPALPDWQESPVEEVLELLSVAQGLGLVGELVTAALEEPPRVTRLADERVDGCWSAHLVLDTRLGIALRPGGTAAALRADAWVELDAPWRVRFDARGIADGMSVEIRQRVTESPPRALAVPIASGERPI